MPEVETFHADAPMDSIQILRCGSAIISAIEKSGGSSEGACAVTLLTLDLFLLGCGGVLAVVGALVARDATHPQRWGSAIFWLLLAVAVGLGKWLPPIVVGYAVLGLTSLVATKRVGAPQFARGDSVVLTKRAEVLGNRLLWPVLWVPVVAIVGGAVLDSVKFGDVALVNPKQVAQIALGLGCIVGLATALRTTGEGPLAAAREGGRLLQLLSWSLILPAMLAALGGIMGKSGGGWCDCRARGDGVAGAVSVGGGGRVLRGHGALYGFVGECVRRISCDDAGSGIAVHSAGPRRRSSGGGRTRDAERLLRDAGHADGGQF